MRKLLTILLCLLMTGIISAQQAMIVGNVRSKSDKRPISDVNIYFKDTDIGTTSDEDGFYLLPNKGKESILVFSSVGYKTQEHKVKGNELIGLYVELKEDNNWLEDLFVLPGANPALEIMDKIRAAKGKNDISKLTIDVLQDKQELIMLKRGRHREKTLNSLKKMDNLAISYDSVLLFPLYLSNEEIVRKGNETPQIVKSEVKSSPENLHMLYEKIFMKLPDKLNPYNNSMEMFGKQFISPLANSGNLYYRYYLMDSITIDNTKQYQIKFKTKNNKNLAFNGDLWVDSASYALTKFQAQLPVHSNINYIRNLKINIDYEEQQEVCWLPSNTELSVNMDYQLTTDSVAIATEILVKKKILTRLSDEELIIDTTFLLADYKQEDLEQRMADFNDTPLMRTAKWIADGVLTGYAKAGYVDIGKVYYIARISEIEGFRFSLPLRTNETLSENFEFGGYWGYGTRNKEHNYSVYAGFRLPFERKTIFSAGYTDDYRRIDYDYNDFLIRENPLLSGDDDIANTVFGFRSSRRLNHRKEFYASLTHDWSSNVETKLYYRNNVYKGNNTLSFLKNGTDIQTMQHQSISLSTRFSSHERSYEDHLSRIYIRNFLPVVYLNIEGGKAVVEQESHLYSKLSFVMNQTMLFSLGEWNYALNGGLQFGKTPYNLLWVPKGSETRIFKPYQYNLMNYGEFAFDSYISMHNELIFNGILLNYIPWIRNLNLREVLTLKCLYGSRSDQHATILDIPSRVKTLSYPYTEVGVGVTNIFKVFSLQSVWRLHDIGKPNVRSWGIIGGIRLSF